MVQIKINENASSYAQNVLIRKGYYPAVVKSIEVFKDKDKKIVKKILKDGTLGSQLIVKFAVYNQDNEGKPTTPVIFKYKVENGPTLEEEVVLASFVFYEYEKAGVTNSALTAKSNAGKLFTALGYDFASKIPLDTETFIGKWAELNIDNYEKEVDGAKVVKSIIKDINKYEGPVMEEVKKSLSKAVEKEVEEEIEIEDLS